MPLRGLRPLTLTARISLVVGALSVFAVGSMLVATRQESIGLTEMRARIAQEHVKTLRRVSDLHGLAFTGFCFDYGYWDELTQFITRPEPKWAAQNLAGTLATYHLDSLWVCDDKGAVIWAKSKGAATSKLPLPASQLRSFAQSKNPTIHFFLARGSGIMEVAASPIVRSMDPERKGKSFGLLVVCREWSHSTIEDLERATDSKIYMRPSPQPLIAGGIYDPKRGIYVVNEELRGPFGEVVGWRQFFHRDELSAMLDVSEARSLWLTSFLIAGLVVTLAVLAFVFVGRPLLAIQRSLTDHIVEPLEPFRNNRSEMGNLASLIEHSIVQGQALQELNDHLEGRVHERTAELENAYEATIAALARALELRDEETEGHCQRVTAMVVKLAADMGLDPVHLVHVRRGALLHDIGKLAIPDRVLLKPGPLNEEEWSVMRQHPDIAKQMLETVIFLGPALVIPYMHHERWDGKGYPQGLAGEDIPLEARIFALVDIWDALRSDRPYRTAWPIEKVREHVISLSGTHLDPMVVEAFLQSPFAMDDAVFRLAA